MSDISSTGSSSKPSLPSFCSSFDSVDSSVVASCFLPRNPRGGNRPVLLGRVLVDTGGVALLFVRPLVTLGIVGALGLFKFPDRLGVVVVDGLEVVTDLPLVKLMGLRNLRSGFVDLLDDSVVVCRGVVLVSLSTYSVNGVSSVTSVVVVNSLASFS